MKVKELFEILKASWNGQEEQVSIHVELPSIGPTAKVPVENASFGFDWNMGHLIIRAEKPLVPIDVQSIKYAFGKLTDKERLDVISGYCKDCGIKQPEGRICQCWNDE